MIYRYHNKAFPVNRVEKISRQFKHFYIRKAPTDLEVKFPNGYFIPMGTGTSFVAPTPINGCELIRRVSGTVSRTEIIELYLSEGPISFGQTSLDSEGNVTDPGGSNVNVLSLPAVNIASNQVIKTAQNNSSFSASTYHFLFNSRNTTLNESVDAFESRTRSVYGLNSSDFNQYVKVIDTATTGFLSATNNPGQSIGRLTGKFCDIVYGGHPQDANNSHGVHLHIATSNTAFSGLPNFAGNEIVLEHGMKLRLNPMPTYMYFVPLKDDRQVGSYYNGISSVSLIIYS